MIVVTGHLEIVKSSDFIIHFKDGEIEYGTYSKLKSESSKFQALIERAEVDKIITESSPGVPPFRSYLNRARNKNHIGLSYNEMVSNQVAISHISKSEQLSYVLEKMKEVIRLAVTLRKKKK